METLYSDRYRNWNVRHFYERYRGEHGGTRSYTWVKNVLQDAGLVARCTLGGTPESTRGDDTCESGDRMSREGMLLHQIASRHEWAAGHTWDLMLTVDDATNRVHSGFFVEERGIWSIFRAIQETLVREGFFGCLNLGLALPSGLTARETKLGGHTRPQLERAMSELGIEMCSPDLRQRTRSARLLRTLHGRLPEELALAAQGTVEIRQANRILTRIWPRLNETLAGQACGQSSTFDTLAPMFQTELGDVLCLKHRVQIHSRGRMSCRGKEFDIPKRAGSQQPLSSLTLRLHEYQGGSCALFAGRDRVAAVELGGRG